MNSNHITFSPVFADKPLATPFFFLLFYFGMLPS
jgi:hypothetical protein